MQKIIWALYRVAFVLFFIGCVLTYNLCAFLVAPLSTYLFTNDFRFWKYLDYSHKIFVFAVQNIRTLYTDNYYFFLSVLLTAPPRLEPDPCITELTEEWREKEFDCFSCGKCCLKINCPLLNHSDNKCIAYGSFCWKYFNCGRFPVNQQQIDYYGCPKWQIKKLHQNGQ